MIEFHPLANLFPLFGQDDFEELALDIADHGLREDIVLLDGKILDGRNRYQACIAANLIDASYEPTGNDRFFVDFRPEYDGDPLAFVISKNLRRRQLDESQRAMVAAKIANMRQGERTDLAEPSANLRKVPQQAAAQMLNISERSLQTAKQVIEKGIPELQQAVERGEIAVSAAASVASQPEEVQRHLVEVDSPAFHAEVKRIRQAKQEQKRARREQRESELGARQVAWPTKRYGVIYDDPAWKFRVYSEQTGMDRAAENHYPTMTIEQLYAMPIADIAADDSVLFRWVTIPFLFEALKLMAHQGYTYKSHYIWGKDKIGPGYWNREKHEILLIGTRGNIPCPAMGQQWDSLLSAPRGEHSAKPDLFAEMIEQYFPNLPKIELNRRGPPRPGWDAWGNEAEATPHIIEESPPCAHFSAPSIEQAPERSDDIDLPAWLNRANRANWVDGRPPAPAAASILSIKEVAHG